MADDDMKQEEQRTQALRRRLDDLGYSRLALGAESVPLVEKLLADLIQAKSQNNSGPLKEETIANEHLHSSDDQQSDHDMRELQPDFTNFNNINRENDNPTIEADDISHDDKISDEIEQSRTDSEVNVKVENKTGDNETENKQEDLIQCKIKNRHNVSSRTTIKNTRASTERNETVISQSEQNKERPEFFRLSKHTVNHINKTRIVLDNGKRRPAYKSYQQNDVALAIVAVEEGLSLRKASVKYGVPYSTLLGKIQNIKQWEATETKENGCNVAADEGKESSVAVDKQVVADLEQRLEEDKEHSEAVLKTDNKSAKMYTEMEISDKKPNSPLEEAKTSIRNCLRVKEMNSKIKNVETAKLKRLKQKRKQKHLSKTEFPCRDCGMVFESSWKLTVHRHRIHKVKPTECDVCGKEYRNERDMRRHRSYAHTLYKSTSCETCGKTFKNFICLKHHRKIHDRSLSMKYQCNKCLKVLSCKYTLEKHFIRVHQENGALAFARFTCHICGKTFEHNSSLKVHIDSVHNKLREFICEVCGKAFPCKNYLREHKRRIHSERNSRNYVCDICEKTYTSKSSLTIHQKSHQPYQDYECNYCGKQFTQKGSLNRHERTVHKGIKEFVCKICCIGFRDSFKVSTHLMSVHKIPKHQTSATFEKQNQS